MSTHHADQHASATPALVLLVTAPDCHFCAQAKEILAALGRTYALEVREVAHSAPEGQALALRHGILFPPGLLLDNTFVGFGRVSERKLRRLLEQRVQEAVAAPSEGA